MRGSLEDAFLESIFGKEIDLFSMNSNKNNNQMLLFSPLRLVGVNRDLFTFVFHHANVRRDGWWNLFGCYSRRECGHLRVVFRQK